MNYPNVVTLICHSFICNCHYYWVGCNSYFVYNTNVEVIDSHAIVLRKIQSYGHLICDIG